MVLQPNFWLSNEDNEDDPYFARKLFLEKETVEVNGEYSEDLDLFYSKEDVMQLFNYFYKDYAVICDLAL